MANDSSKTPFDSWQQQRCHPNSPAGRYLTAQEIRLPAFPERVQSVANAYFQALRLAQFTRLSTGFDSSMKFRKSENFVVEKSVDDEPLPDLFITDKGWPELMN